MTKEMLEKLKAAANTEELMTLAKENGLTLEAAEAQKLFDTLKAPEAGELSEEDLAQVSGGIWLLVRQDPDGDDDTQGDVCRIFWEPKSDL